MTGNDGRLVATVKFTSETTVEDLDSLVSLLETGIDMDIQVHLKNGKILIYRA